jgi:hypothetical protein
LYLDFKEAFKMLDKGTFTIDIVSIIVVLSYDLLILDGDGQISWEELGFVMKTLGHKVSESHLKEIMKLIDENGNGVIDFEE